MFHFTWLVQQINVAYLNERSLLFAGMSQSALRIYIRAVVLFASIQGSLNYA